MWSIGSPNEVASGWVDSFNPYAKAGRFMGRAPNQAGDFDLQLGTYTIIGTGLRPFYGQWNHIAFVHEQASGINSALYLNGVLVATGTHDRVSVAAPGNPRQNVLSLMVCGWAFWSGCFPLFISSQYM
jgi:hypothetical protein